MKAFSTLIGRILFAIPFFFFGIFHFVSGEGMSKMIPEFFTFRLALVYITGIALILASISIIIKKYAVLACYLLALFLFTTIAFIHIPGLSDESLRQMATPSLLKDIALAGSALFIGSNIEK